MKKLTLELTDRPAITYKNVQSVDESENYVVITTKKVVDAWAKHLVVSIGITK